MPIGIKGEGNQSRTATGDLIEIDCSQFAEQKVELAGYISERLEARGVALVQNEAITIDWLSEAGRQNPSLIASIIRSFLESKNLSGQYSVDSVGDFIAIVAQPGTPLTKKDVSRSRPELPPNVFQRSHCGYISENEFQLRLHERLHYLRF